MKKLLQLFVILLCLLGLSACAGDQSQTKTNSQPQSQAQTNPQTQPQEDGILLPPNRVSAGMLIDYVRAYNLVEATSEADAIVWVRIGNWLGEAGEYTHFEAEVVQCLKGEQSGTMEICQMGTSAGTVQGYPLFTYGNEKLLFLKNRDGAWYMINDNQTVMDVVQCQDGNAYAVPQFQWFLAWLEPSLPFENHADREDLRQDICDALTARDSLYNGKPERMEYILSLEDLEKLLP